MDESGPAGQVNIGKTILFPGLITLGVTILRVVGELQGWSPILFGRAAGGGGAIVGISWLPLVLGPYFAVKLNNAGLGPAGCGRAIGYTIGALVIFFLAGFVGFAPQISFPGRMAVGYVLMVVAAGITVAGWPALGKTLIAYAYVARIPVAIVMFFAIRGSWGTHYDALPPDYSGPADLATKFILVGLLPQMIFWVVATLIVGALLGTIAAAVIHRRPAPVSVA